MTRETTNEGPVTDNIGSTMTVAKPVESSHAKPVLAHTLITQPEQLIAIYKGTFDSEYDPTIILDPSILDPNLRAIYGNESFFTRFPQEYRSNIRDFVEGRPIHPTGDGSYLTIPEAIKAGKILRYIFEPITLVEFDHSSHQIVATPVIGLFNEVNVRVTIKDITQLEDVKAENRRLNKQLEVSRDWDSEKDELLHLLAHDLRNPLTVVQGQAQIIQRRIADTPGNESNNKSASSIIEATRRMTSKLNLLLNLFRELNPATISVADLLQQLAEENYLYASNRGADIHLVAPEQSATLYTDERVLLPLLSNLILNSIQAGATNITIAHEEYGEKSHVYIGDDGVGIAKAMISLVGTREMRSSKGGSGSSLYFINRILNRLNARLNVPWSETNQGTIFDIASPLHQKN